MRTRSRGPGATNDPVSSDSHDTQSQSSSSSDGEAAEITQKPRRISLPEVTSGVRPRKSTDETARNATRTQSNSSTSPSRHNLKENSLPSGSPTKSTSSQDMALSGTRRRVRLRSPWSCSFLTLVTTFLAASLALVTVRSFLTRQLDPKGCAMSYMRPAFAKFPDFDTEHTRFASKYSLYLYREGGVDEDTRVKGIPVLFIPGNAGSYKQVRPLAAEAAVYFQETFQGDQQAMNDGKRTLDFFSVDFNEDITAFHGQSLLDQAEYLNEAIAFILSLYHKPNRSLRDADLPDPSSVIIVGHSMGGIVARTMLTMHNYQSNSINTIVTLSAPHARAPVSFDAEIVNTYKRVNKYWRDAYSQRWANNNPLWHVTLISIAGGGLDTVVPSDYATLGSLVPPTHGFTVFTSTIPRVWTGMDHLSITWCDQLRKSVIRSLYDVVDASRPSQTRPRTARMQAFKKSFLTGMEDVVEKTLAQREPGTLLTLEDNSNAIISQGESLTLRSLGQSGKAKAHIIPIPPQGSPDPKRFTFLSDQKLDPSGSGTLLDVMFCSVFPLHSGQSSAVFSMNMDFSGNTSGSTRLACKNAASDTILLPASTRTSKYPFDDSPPFSYLQYDLDQLAEHQFVAIVDKATSPTPGWAIAEFSSKSNTRVSVGLRSLILSGMDYTIPAERPLMTEINIPSMYSSLVTYRLSISKQACGDESELFTPLLRQYLSDPYESKFFVNLKDADISMHGVAPYIPPSLKSNNAVRGHDRGITLQLWSDPTCTNSLDISIKVDILGSFGKLWMRYRTLFAALPLMVVALVLRKQFQLYDKTGVFMSFSESMEQALRRSIPLLLLAMTLLAASFSRETEDFKAPGPDSFSRNATITYNNVNFSRNDLLLGSQDAFFWFLMPFFGTISVGICIVVNYVILATTHFLSFVYTRSMKASSKNADGGNILNAFTTASLRKRIITTSILLLLVSTVIPYQFVFMVLCIVQVSTCVKALSLAREINATDNVNFYNYSQSILILMIWILPINMPVLVVWIHNLAVHWLTPFSSHHNILSIMPFVLLVETLSTGRMVPRVETWIRHSTSLLFFALAVYATVYGVTYAYLLHSLANIICAWLAAVHFSSSEFWTGQSSIAAGFSKAMERSPSGRHKVKKRP